MDGAAGLNSAVTNAEEDLPGVVQKFAPPRVRSGRRLVDEGMECLVQGQVGFQPLAKVSAGLARHHPDTLPAAQQFGRVLLALLATQRGHAKAKDTRQTMAQAIVVLNEPQPG